MKFTVAPTSITHASNFGCVVVDLENETNNTDSVTLSIGTNPSSGVLSGTLTEQVVDGVAVFGPLQISLAGVGYTLVATAPLQHNVFAPGYYYNYPPSGEPDFPFNTVTGIFVGGNVAPVATTASVITAPFTAT